MQQDVLLVPTPGPLQTPAVPSSSQYQSCRPRGAHSLVTEMAETPQSDQPLCSKGFSLSGKQMRFPVLAHLSVATHPVISISLPSVKQLPTIFPPLFFFIFCWKILRILLIPWGCFPSLTGQNLVPCKELLLLLLLRAWLRSAGSVLTFTISCTRQWLQRTVGTLSSGLHLYIHMFLQ